MRIELSGSLSRAKDEANRLIVAHFNDIALRTLQDDLVAMVQANPARIMEREDLRQMAFARVLAATDVAGVKKITDELDIQDGLR